MKRFLLTSLVLCLVCSILEVYGQGTISGFSSVCSGSSAQYSVSGSSATSGYTWTPPSGSTITSGQGSKTVTISFGTIIGSGLYIYVSGNGLNANEAITIVSTAPSPGAISGPAVLCPGGSATFSSSISTPYTSVIWYVTNGSATVTSQTSSAIVSIPANASLSSLQVNVFEVNGMCGPGPTVSKTVTIVNQLPSAPTVTGNAQVCLSAQGVVYTAASTNANGYIWSVPAGATIASGQNTGSITVNYPSSAVSGNVSVYGTNCIGNGSSSSLAITSKPLPLAATTITGIPSVCPGDQSVAYSVPAITGATGYLWSVPAGATIATGQNTTTIAVNYSSTSVSGNVSVYGTNCNGNGSSSSYAVTVKPGPSQAGVISGKIQACPGESSIPYSVPAIANASGYTWNVPAGATITSGQNTNSILVDFPSTVSPGTISVAGTGCGVTGISSLLYLPFSYTASAENVTYSVDQVTGTLMASLPLFSIQSGDIQVPGVLSYGGTGVKVQDDDGTMGHNWNVSTQSYGIFRNMRNLPDDYFKASGDTRKGWLFGTLNTTIKNLDPLAGSDNNPATCTDEGANYTTLNGLTYDMDTEPDAFHVSAPGLSVDFYFDETGVPHTVPLQDLVITPYTAPGVAFNGTTGPITYFTIIDAKGVTYTFSETEYMTENMLQVDNYYFVRQTNQHVQPYTYTTGWRLTNIKSPVYGNIDISYNTVTLVNSAIEPSKGMTEAWWFDRVSWELKYNYHYPLVTSNRYGAGSTLTYRKSLTILKVLATISSTTGSAVFSSAPKYSGSQMQRLNTIQVYDNRTGLSKLVRQIDFSYTKDHWQDITVTGVADNRVMLGGITITAGCSQAHYGFDYNNSPSLPAYDSPDEDEWGYYKTQDGSYSYDETAVAGSLHKISQPLGGYTVFFYQSHDYLSGGATVKGGGIRIQKIITYDGVSSANDLIQEYFYTAADGVTSSGKLQHRAALSFSVVIQNNLTGYTGPVRYSGAGDPTQDAMFTLTGSYDMSHPGSLNGSMVAYERVTVKTKDVGQSVYEYDLPASADDVMANNGEWTASKVYIARPSATSCLVTPNITEGYYRYPFPVNPNYEFARGLLKKVTSFDVNNVKVRDIVYNYQRVYGVGNTDIRKIYGLALEELPSFSTIGATGKMFLYAHYEIFTDVKTELRYQTETVYNSTDLSQNQAVTTNYFYDSPNHRELARIEIQNSDGSLSKSKLVYNKDYTITTASGMPAAALVNLKNAHRTILVEKLSTKVIGNKEKYMGASLTLFQTIGTIAYPDKQYTFVSTAGSTFFIPSSITAGTTFQYDQSHYVLGKTFLSFDGFGNATSVVDKSRIASSIVYGYGGTLPVVQVSNAAIGEIGYADFETAQTANFTFSGFSPTYSTGRLGTPSTGLNLPAGSATTSMLVMSTVSNNQSQNYIFSAWIKSGSAGTISIKVFNTATGTSTVFPYSYTASSAYQYYTFTVPVSTVIGTNASFYIFEWSSAAIQIDDVAFYPEQADIVTSAYMIPNGKTSDTDSKGSSYFYENDWWGRPLVVYDRNRNVIKKYNYQSR